MRASSAEEKKMWMWGIKNLHSDRESVQGGACTVDDLTLTVWVGHLKEIMINFHFNAQFEGSL